MIIVEGPRVFALSRLGSGWPGPAPSPDFCAARHVRRRTCRGALGAEARTAARSGVPGPRISFGQKAFDGSGIPWARCFHEDRGDGALIVVPPGVACKGIIDPLPERLRGLIRRHNHVSCPAAGIQLRAAAHIGPVEHDGHGFVGSDINLLFRMLEARPLKRALAGSGAELALIVSDHVYRSLVCRCTGTARNTPWRTAPPPGRSGPARHSSPARSSGPPPSPRYPARPCTRRLLTARPPTPPTPGRHRRGSRRNQRDPPPCHQYPAQRHRQARRKRNISAPHSNGAASSANVTAAQAVRLTRTRGMRCRTYRGSMARHPPTGKRTSRSASTTSSLSSATARLARFAAALCSGITCWTCTTPRGRTVR